MPPRGSKYPPASIKTTGKRGPKPFPGTRRKRCDLRVPPPKPILRHTHHCPRKRKIEVLTWLVCHLVSEPRRTEFGEPYVATRMKIGQARMTVQEQAELKQINNSFAVLYRPPTYLEAEAFWKIPCSTIARWWRRKEKYLPPDILEKAKSPRIELMGGSTPYRAFSPGVVSREGGPEATGAASTHADPSQGTTSEPVAMDISDGSDSETDDSDDSDSDEDLPDINTALGVSGNTESTEETGDTGEYEEFRDAQEFQQEAEEYAEGDDSAVYALQAC
ncbi:hypothetical protein F5X99DRAFT_215070 [Biscogniauxia marginata]|nr:hypothetical protein F5X99DRAFT_215070 [Biscogniauxia marginata]